MRGRDKTIVIVLFQKIAIQETQENQLKKPKILESHQIVPNQNN